MSEVLTITEAITDFKSDYEVVRDEAFKTSVSVIPQELLMTNDKQDICLKGTFYKVDKIRPFIMESLEALGLQSLNVVDYLQSQAQSMFERFEPKLLNCRMELIFTDKCKKFHVDRVNLRSITTIIGPGTEFQLLGEEDTVYQMQTGESLLMKGKLFPGGNPTLKHRSPPIAHKGIGRLIFVIDF